MSIDQGSNQSAWLIDHNDRMLRAALIFYIPFYYYYFVHKHTSLLAPSLILTFYSEKSEIYHLIVCRKNECGSINSLYYLYLYGHIKSIPMISKWQWIHRENFMCVDKHKERVNELKDGKFEAQQLVSQMSTILGNCV
jgi:hypothetical protein